MCGGGDIRHDGNWGTARYLEDDAVVRGGMIILAESYTYDGYGEGDF